MSASIAKGIDNLSKSRSKVRRLTEYPRPSSLSCNSLTDDFANEMSNQTVIMQQQLNQQREAAYQPNFNAQKQVQQERFNTFNTFN